MATVGVKGLTFPLDVFDIL